MKDFKNGESLCKFDGKVKSFKKAIELIMGEENRNEEDSSEGYDDPQREAYSVVGEKVVLS